MSRARSWSQSFCLVICRYRQGGTTRSLVLVKHILVFGEDELFYFLTFKNGYPFNQLIAGTAYSHSEVGDFRYSHHRPQISCLWAGFLWSFQLVFEQTLPGGTTSKELR